jgi:CRISPR/Cas system-associated exonuclease Cas4 (RecB family)
LENHFEAPIEAKDGSIHILAGKIDRIDKLNDGEYEIIDYKTGKRMPSQDSLNNDLQLSLYSFALQKRWPHLKPDGIKLSLYFLKHGEKLSAVSSKETTEKAKNHVLKTISDIEEKLQKGTTFEPTPNPLCDWCGYKPMCPAWRHLYQKSEIRNPKSENEINAIVKEYFEIKNTQQKNDARLEELQGQIKDYMERERLTRVFGDDGYISKKNQQRYEYDFDKVKSILAPLGKWEEILKAYERKLLKVMREIREEARTALENSRAISKEFITLTTFMKKFKNPEDAAGENEEIENTEK